MPPLLPERVPHRTSGSGTPDHWQSKPGSEWSLAESDIRCTGTQVPYRYRKPGISHWLPRKVAHLPACTPGKLIPRPLETLADNPSVTMGEIPTGLPLPPPLRVAQPANASQRPPTADGRANVSAERRGVSQRGTL